MNAVNDSREVLTSVKHLETTSREIFASSTTYESRKLNYFISRLSTHREAVLLGGAECKNDPEQVTQRSDCRYCCGTTRDDTCHEAGYVLVAELLLANPHLRAPSCVMSGRSRLHCRKSGRSLLIDNPLRFVAGNSNPS